MFANARMYSLEPVTAAAWRALLEWVLARAGIEGDVLDYPAPQPLPALWARPDLGCAFMCGYPLVRASPQPLPLAAVVPRPARYRGAAVYWTDLVVQERSALRTASDALGKRLAFTTEESQSGYQALRRFFADFARNAPSRRLFAEIVGPLVTPRNVVRAVLEGEADAGPLDSYAHDLLRAHEPALVAGLRVIASTPPMPIAPLVAAAGTPPDVVARLRRALTAAGAADELAALRETLLIDRFVPVDAQRYAVLLACAREADALGYARLA